MVTEEKKDVELHAPRYYFTVVVAVKNPSAHTFMAERLVERSTRLDFYIGEVLVASFSKAFVRAWYVRVHSAQPIDELYTQEITIAQGGAHNDA